MRHRYRKFYADWRDANGKRRMKACRTERAAQTLTKKMHNRGQAAKRRALKASLKNIPQFTIQPGVLYTLRLTDGNLIIEQAKIPSKEKPSHA